MVMCKVDKFEGKKNTLESQVLEFTYANKAQCIEFQATSNFCTNFYQNFLEKTPITPKSFPVRME